MKTIRRLGSRAWELRWLLFVQTLVAAVIGYVIAEIMGN